jgi:opacity protein-like surface antigen
MPAMSLTRTIAVSALAATFAGAVPPAALAAAASPPPIPASALEKAEWYVVIDGQQVGPLTASAVERRMDDGSVSPDTFVWREGMKDWTPVAQTATFVGRRVDAALKQPKGPTPLDNKFVLAARF